MVHIGEWAGPLAYVSGTESLRGWISDMFHMWEWFRPLAYVEHMLNLLGRAVLMDTDVSKPLFGLCVKAGVCVNAYTRIYIQVCIVVCV